MNRFLQNLLMGFALCLCALIAYQWHRETRSHEKIQTLYNQDTNNKETIRTLQGQLKNTEEEVRRLEEIKFQLTETVKSNRLEITQFQKDLDKANAQIERQGQQIDAYKVAVEQANDNIKKQNENITAQNEQLKQLV